MHWVSRNQGVDAVHNNPHFIQMAKKASTDNKLSPKRAVSKSFKPDSAALDLGPDAWTKFEKLVKSAAKMGPKPHVSSKQK